MNRIKTAIIGAGHLGRIHARLADSLDEIEVIGVVDPSADARSQIERDLKLPCFASTEDLPASLQAAIVAAPTGLHQTIAQPLLERGVHVLVEKPITVTTDEAHALIAAADASGSILQVGHVERFNPAFQRLQEKVDQAKFVETRRTSEYTFRSTDVGVVLDLMIHDLDLVLSLVNSPLRAGRCRRHFDHGRERGHRPGTAGVRERIGGSAGRLAVQLLAATIDSGILGSGVCSSGSDESASSEHFAKRRGAFASD